MDIINRLEKEIAELRALLQEKEGELFRYKNEWAASQQTNNIQDQNGEGDKIKQIIHISDKLPKWAIERYSRQILLPEIGVSGQEKLCAAKVLIVGAGGLGCPAAVYLAGAGVGQQFRSCTRIFFRALDGITRRRPRILEHSRSASCSNILLVQDRNCWPKADENNSEITIVDYDIVDVTNIHRQFLHSENDRLKSKAESAAIKLRSLNSNIKVTPYNMQLSSENALQLASGHDIVLDCSDNVPTRYMLSDTCVLAKIPLISGSALKLEGQLTVYGYRDNLNANDKVSSYWGPCYRCLFPQPPPASAVGSCSANGVAGPVPGVIGALQALEAIKYIVGQSRERLLVERMLIFDGEDMTFRTVKLRPRSSQCPSCSENPSITQLVDYEVFCQAQAKEKRKQESRLKSEIRKREKEKRMSGQSYFGFRTDVGGTTKWVQDVPKSERRLGPMCLSEICSKNTLKKCRLFSQKIREELFSSFWSLDWSEKKSFVRSLVDSVPVKRRRLKIKGEVSRKGDSKLYHLMYDGERLPVCRVMFLNTLGIKEAMVRCWLINEVKPKMRTPTKSLNVNTYIDNLPKTTTKCQYCHTNGVKYQYIDIASVKNLFQLYTMYVRDMKLKNIVPASRKTFSKVIFAKNIRIFKAKNVNDVCDVIAEHNNLPSFNYDVDYYMSMS